MRKGNICIFIVAVLAMTFGAIESAMAQNYEILSNTKNPEEIVRALKERLELSPEQEEKVRSIIVDDFEKRYELKKKYSKDSTDELALLIEQRRLTKETEGKILEILNEEQMAAYEAFKKEYLAKVQREARAKITDESILMMKERLQLTEEQADIVLPIIDQAMKERQALMQKMRGGGNPGGGRGDMSAMMGMREEMERIDERTEERLSKVLTEEQMKEYRKIKKEERDKRREIMRDQMGGGRGGMGGGGRGGGGRK